MFKESKKLTVVEAKAVASATCHLRISTYRRQPNSPRIHAASLYAGEHSAGVVPALENRTALRPNPAVAALVSTVVNWSLVTIFGRPTACAVCQFGKTRVPVA